uniref:Kazal-like domain-containing protein n=1 Tax=Panagrellus redivivus TaxID=6233 RepID=A0A7E4VQD7_PANRE
MKRPLYTAGTRCRSNNACLDAEYPICDMELGLCQQGKLPYHCGRYRNPTVRISKQACSADVDSGSLMSTAERRLTVDAMNVQRGLITNECNAWGSDVGHVF